MTTKYVLIISLGLILLSLFSCTRNNGGESQLYGQWKLQRIVIDGKEDTDYQGNMFWKFQNKTIEMLLVTQEHDQVHSFGNYRLTDNTLSSNSLTRICRRS